MVPFCMYHCYHECYVSYPACPSLRDRHCIAREVLKYSFQPFILRHPRKKVTHRPIGQWIFYYLVSKACFARIISNTF